MHLDLRAALRALRRTPAFTVGAVLTLAVALGLVTTAFGLLFGALAGDTLAAPDRMVLYLTEDVSGRTIQTRWPFAAIRMLREESRSLARIATYTTATLNLSGATTDAERIDVEFVSPEYFDVLGVSATGAGRTFPALSDSRFVGVEGPAAGADVVLISDRFWRRSFGASPEAVGRTVRLSRLPLTIAGILPPDFRGLSGRADIWIPYQLAPVLSFGGYFTSEEYFHNVIAQLKPGVSVSEARSELAVIGAHISASVPPRSDDATARSATLTTLSDARTDRQTVRARTFVAIGAVLVLLIAAVNVANLVVARIAARRREFAVRLAVGASQRRVLRAVAVEMSLVTGGGLVAGLIAAAWTRDVVAVLLPPGLANPANDYGQLASLAGLQIDLPVLAVVGALAVATMMLVSVLACRQVLRHDLIDAMKQRGAPSGVAPGHAQRSLLAVQVALSIALLASAGLLFRTVAALSDIDPGFDATNVVAFSVAEDLAVQRPDVGPALVERLLDHVRRVPGVQNVTVGQCTPYGTRCARLAWITEGADPPSPPISVGWHRVGPDHFTTLGIRVVRGRGFTDLDRRGRPPVVVINEAAARRFFPDRDPIGLRLRLPEVVPGDPDIAEIVGIVGDVVYWPPNEAPGPAVYQPALQFSHPWTTVMVKTAGDPIARIPDLRRALRDLDANLPLFDIVTLGELARVGRADRRFLAVLLAACATVGLLLAAIGVYAMTASWMEARRQELGVRVALGAHPASLVQLVMRGTLLQAALGLAAGVLLALGAGRVLGSVLFGVNPADPATLAAAASVMLAITASAAYLPARRALRIDPVRELNAE